jgi:hypothetical protein
MNWPTALVICTCVASGTALVIVVFAAFMLARGPRPTETAPVVRPGATDRRGLRRGSPGYRDF